LEKKNLVEEWLVKIWLNRIFRPVESFEKNNSIFSVNKKQMIHVNLTHLIQLYLTPTEPYMTKRNQLDVNWTKTNMIFVDENQT